LDILLILLPIIAVLGLLVFLKWPADLAGLIGWLLTVAIAYLFFHTSLRVSLTSTVMGMVRSFPVSLMVATSLLQITFLESTGALQRIVVFVKTIARSNHAVQIMIINMGIGTLLVAVGATPVSILPPIMLAMGYSTFVAVALPALGFDGLCTYALLGAPLVAFADLTGTPISSSALVFSKFMPVISTMIGFGMLWIVGGWKKVVEGFIPCLLAGLSMGFTAVAVAHWLPNGVVLTGVFAGLATILVMMGLLKVQGGTLIDRSAISESDLAVENSMSLFKALAPWLILIICCLIVNFWAPALTLLSKKLAMPFNLIPGGKPIATRMLWNAYTWVIISTLLAVPFLTPTKKQWKEIGLKWLKRAPRPVFSAAIFFAIAEVLVNSGMSSEGAVWKIANPDWNMISVLATTSANFFKGLYPVVAAYLGLMGGFVTGSEASAIALYAKYNAITTKLLNLNTLVVTAGIAIAGGLASVISPAKLQNAAATIDALGIESKVIKTAVIIAIVFTAVAAILTYIWA
jgi:lactate permease